MRSRHKMEANPGIRCLSISGNQNRDFTNKRSKARDSTFLSNKSQAMNDKEWMGQGQSPNKNEWRARSCMHTYSIKSATNNPNRAEIVVSPPNVPAILHVTPIDELNGRILALLRVGMNKLPKHPLKVINEPRPSMDCWLCNRKLTGDSSEIYLLC
jgi:hypothetical protein